MIAGADDRADERKRNMTNLKGPCESCSYKVLLLFHRFSIANISQVEYDFYDEISRE